MKREDKKLLTIGEVAEEISSSASQIRKWERAGLMPEPAVRKKVGKRLDRRYTWAQVEQMRQIRYKLSAGAPTAAERDLRQEIRDHLRPTPPSTSETSSSSPECGFKSGAPHTR